MMTALSETDRAHTLVAAHYAKRAERFAGTLWGTWNASFARKAAAGHDNALTRRVRRMIGGAA